MAVPLLNSARIFSSVDGREIEESDVGPAVLVDLRREDKTKRQRGKRTACRPLTNEREDTWSSLLHVNKECEVARRLPHCMTTTFTHSKVQPWQGGRESGGFTRKLTQFVHIDVRPSEQLRRSVSVLRTGGKEIRKTGIQCPKYFPLEI